MSPAEAATRDALVARLAASRAELRHVFEPPADESAKGGTRERAGSGEFPRSRTMRMLMSGRGLGALGATAAGLLIARPALLWRLVRLLPTSAVARMLIVRLIGAMRPKDSAK
jgi:hypothetical protein